ncbi:hypothetical protein EE612_041634 [Oryza sativa]|nr:hypothetical protein EE612_041634 [Oryza sativa]
MGDAASLASAAEMVGRAVGEVREALNEHARPRLLPRLLPRRRLEGRFLSYSLLAPHLPWIYLGSNFPLQPFAPQSSSN